jgi:hypothetical protein
MGGCCADVLGYIDRPLLEQLADPRQLVGQWPAPYKAPAQKCSTWLDSVSHVLAIPHLDKQICGLDKLPTSQL